MITPMITVGKKSVLPEKRRARSPGWNPDFRRPEAKRCEYNLKSAVDKKYLSGFREEISRGVFGRSASGDWKI